MPGFSYSSIKTFEQCPRKYFHLKVAKDVHDPGGEPALYGQRVHKAAEDCVRDGTPIPDKYEYMKPIVESLMRIPGEKLAEEKLGIRQTVAGEFEDCLFEDEDFWWHGIADLLVIDDSGTAWCVDYKTGKNAKYSDLRQLDLLAAGVMIRYPQVHTVRSALLYVVTGDFVPKDHTRDNLHRYVHTFRRQLETLEKCRVTSDWYPVEGPLCGWCPVESCEHWKDRKNGW